MIEKGAFPADYDIALGGAGFLVTEADAANPQQQALRQLLAQGFVEVVNQTASRQLWRLTDTGIRHMNLAVFAKGRLFLRDVALERVGNIPWLELTLYELFAALRKEKFRVQVLAARVTRRRLPPYNGEAKLFYVRPRTSGWGEERRGKEKGGEMKSNEQRERETNRQTKRVRSRDRLR